MFIKFNEECQKAFNELNNYNEELKAKGLIYIPKKDNPQEIIIKDQALDLSNLKEDNTSKILWRPQTFEQYKGQESLKKILQGYIKGTKNLDKPFPHMMIDGKAGSGKTTIAYLVAKELKLNFVECVATTLESQQQLVDRICEANGGILFIDEIHMINKKLANFILPILEDFQISGKKIKPFTLFSATTEKGSLIKKYKPFVDRMKIQKTLEPYTFQELTILTKQYKDKTFPESSVDELTYEKIAKNCRGTPRIALRYLDSHIFMNCPIEEVFHTYNIVKNGITVEDIKLLKLLNEKENGIGLNSICAYLGTSKENYLYQIESYLLEQGLITITTRREITKLGKEFIKNYE